MISWNGCQSQGGDGANARHLLKTRGKPRAPASCGDMCVEFRDPLRQTIDLVKAELRHRTNRSREISGLLILFQSQSQFADVLPPLACNDVELGEVAAKRVDRLRALPDQQVP